MHKLLFVEDDHDLAKLLTDFLLRYDMQVVVESQGERVVSRVQQENPDMVLLDVMLPGKDGLSICKELRPQFAGPIILFTSLDSDMNQILGLELGANDYIVKTTPPPVLAARLRAHLRNIPFLHKEKLDQNSVKGSGVLYFGQLSIDPISRDVTMKGEKISLSTADFDLLWFLASHAGSILKRDTLFKEMKGMDYDGLDRSIDVAISRLRKKLKDNPSEPFRIKTVRNKGYLFSISGWNE